MTITVATAPVIGASPAVQVDVTSSPSVTDLMTVWRVHEDGTEHEVLVPSSTVLVGSWSGFDYHAPFNQQVTYYAVAGGLTSAESGPAVVLSDSIWLIHPTDPALSVMVDWMAKVGDYSFAPVTVRSKVLNSKLPRFSPSAPREGEKGSLTVMVEGDAQRRAMRALLADGGQVLLNTPHSDVELGWKWVQPGEYTESNPTERHRNDVRTGTFTYEECRQPDADVRIWTIDERRAAFPGYTVAAAGAVYSTLERHKLDIRS